MANANSTVLDPHHALHPIALEATYQIENLAFIASRVLDESADPVPQAVKTLVDRVLSLNSIIMTTLDEPDTDPQPLADRVGISRRAYEANFDDHANRGNNRGQA